MILKRKKILAINFFPAFSPPKSGGELRYHYIYKHLSRTFDIVMVNPTFPDIAPETVWHNDSWVEHRIPKSQRHKFLHHLFDRIGHFAECSAVVVALAARGEKEFRAKSEEMSAQADIVIHDSPFLIHVVPRRPGQLLIYNSYNVEYDLQRTMLPGVLGKALCYYVKRLERRAVREADIVFAVSEEDKKRFVYLYDVCPLKVKIVPNGIDPSQLKPATSEEKRAARKKWAANEEPLVVFFGAAHPPNKEAARFIIDRLAPALPEAKFLIAGGVAKFFSEQPPTNVSFLGIVSDEERRSLLAGADVAVNPMHSGSGSNLKILDYLAAGVATVATPIGARGFDLRDGKDMLIAEEDEFAPALKQLISDADLRLRLARQGRKTIEQKYDWQPLAESVVKIIGVEEQARVTLINDFPIYSARLGEHNRAFNLYRYVAKHYPVTAICLDRFTQELTERTIDENFVQLIVPKTGFHGILDGLLGRYFGHSVDDAIAIVMSRLNHRFKQALRYAARRPGVFVSHHPYVYGTLRSAPAHPRIYEAHNAEYVLKKAMLRGWLGRFLTSLTFRAERYAFRSADTVFCVSDSDRASLEELYGSRAKVELIPNGTDARAIKVLPDDEREAWKRSLGLNQKRILVFIGSAHPPNVEAGSLICTKLAPALSEHLFLLVGGVCWRLKDLPPPPNVKLLFEVEDSVRNVLLEIADVAINPMTYGSGSSLKMFDFLAAGLPVVSTAPGARGIEFTNGAELVTCPIEEFPAAINSILADRERQLSLRSMARRLVEQKHDWAIIAERITAIIAKMLSSSSQQETS
jgi:glycosyltransferase involved in cell wall biosynthesis